MHQRLLLFFALTFIAGCSNLEKVENRDENGLLTEAYFLNKKTGTKQGAYKAFFPNGNLREESFYENDLLHGDRNLYYETGKLLSTERHEHGKFAGKYMKYFESGQLSNEGEYVDNEMSGIWKRWYPDGILREEVTFAGNLENGPFREFHPNGKIMTEGEYLAGEFENGELKKYDESGQLYERMHCELGICMAVWSISQGDILIDSARLKILVELKSKLNN